MGFMRRSRDPWARTGCDKEEYKPLKRKRHVPKGKAPAEEQTPFWKKKISCARKGIDGLAEQHIPSKKNRWNRGGAETIQEEQIRWKGNRRDGGGIELIDGE
jgi:hypothetical protein